MRFTQAQVREAVGLPPETIRHWRKVLAPLRAKTGHAAVFTFGDLIALAIVRAFVDDLGLPVGRFAASAGRLFELCNMKPWPQLADAVAVISSDGVWLYGDPIPQASVSRACAMVRIEPLVVKLRAALLDERAAERQQRLPFPPAVIASGS